MKKLAVVVAVLVVASSAMAIGPMAQTAAPVDEGTLSAMVGVVIGVGDIDQTLIDFRATYGAIENLSLALDIGYETEGEVIPLSVSGQYCLNDLLGADLPVDLAVDLSLDIGDLENAGDTLALTPVVVVSSDIEQVDGLALYAGIGAVIPMGNLADAGAETELLVAGGATYGLDALVENLGAYVELLYVAELFVGFGATYDF